MLLKLADNVSVGDEGKGVIIWGTLLSQHLCVCMHVLMNI